MAQYKVEVSGINTGSLPLLSNDEKETLIRRIKQGDKEARTRYIQGNLRLVLSIIKRFQNSNENMDDLFQIGCIKSTKIKENKNTANKEVKIKKEKDTKKKVESKEGNSRKNIKIDNKVETKKNKRGVPKKDRKINITQEDLDKLCEVYDWYMEVKDLKSMKIKAKTNKKDIKIEDTNIDTLKSTSIKVDKKTWEDFERLCSNSKFTKQEIITQALKDFMKEYKNLL